MSLWGNKFTRYGEAGPGTYMVYDAPPAGTSVLPPGAYSGGVDGNGRTYFQALPIVKDDLIDSNYTELRTIVTKFWASEGKFKLLGLTYKRGVLVYGRAGCGKTCILNQFVEELVKAGGIAIYGDRGEMYQHLIKQIHAFEPDRKIITITEDIDKKISGSMLEYLDGYMSQDKVLNIATTNYLDRLPDTIKNRPSRFDTVLEIKGPGEAVRAAYLKRLFDRLGVTPDPRYVEQTEGFTFAELKELFVATQVLDQGFEATVERFRKAAGLGTSTAGVHDPHECDEHRDDCSLCQEHFDEDGDCQVECERSEDQWEDEVAAVA